MSGQVRRAWEAIAEVHWTFRDTREDRHRSIPVGLIAQHDRCPRGVSRLHAPELCTPDPSHVVDWGQIEVDTDGTLRRDQCTLLIAVTGFCDARP